MNWISNVVPPKIRSFLRRDTPEISGSSAPRAASFVFHKDLEANLMVVPGSGYHMAVAPRARLAALFDGGEYENCRSGDAGRPSEVPGHQALRRPPEGASPEDGFERFDHGRRR